MISSSCASDWVARGRTIIEDTHAVVEGFGRQVLFRVRLDLLHDRRIWKRYALYHDRVGGLLAASASHQHVKRARHGVPAIVSDVLRHDCQEAWER